MGDAAASSSRPSEPVQGRPAGLARRIGRLFGRLAAGLAAFAAMWSLAGMAMAGSDWGDPPRGTFVEVDGRRQRVVCMGEGAPGAPLVVFEAGAYSGAADWGYIQPEIARGARACAYDRFGIGWSDPAPAGRPRDPVTLAGELDALLKAMNAPGPYVLVGHSMAGIHLRAFVAAHPERVAGLVLIDAADPSAIELAEARIWISRYQRLARFGAGAARFGLVKPLSPFFANRIGLSGPALAEKRRMFGHPRHLAAASAEINAVTDNPRALDGADARIARVPVAAVTAGPPGGAWHAAQVRAARLSELGFEVSVADATHTSILGPVHGRQTVQAIERVLAAATAAATAGPD